MTIHLETDEVLLWEGDCIELMRSLPDGILDSVVTDPPYGLEFMGRKWDGADGFRRSLNPNDVTRPNVFGRTSRTSPEYRAGIVFEEWTEQWARECLRLLKPGGHLLAFGGTRTWHRLASGIEDAGFEMRDSIAWLYGSGFPKSKALLKPAFEPIVLARKKGPLQELNIDACRIPHDEKSAAWVQKWSGHEGHPEGLFGGNLGTQFGGSASGRWPANVVMDRSQAAVLDEQSGVLTSGSMTPVTVGSKRQGAAYGTFKARTPTGTYADSGGASRFFYVAKASKRERPKHEDGSAHPTVKPLKLMEWLVRLVTPAGGLVLDPFAGSGTTVEACIREGYRCMAMERETEYIPLIKQRIDRASKKE